jgi:hypothetical protein
MDCDFMGEPRSDGHVWDNGSPFDPSDFTVCVSVRNGSLLWIPERDLPHLTPLGQNLLYKPQAPEHLKCARLQAICLAGFQRGGFGVDAEKRGIGQAVSSEQDFEEESCWASLPKD